MNTTLVKVISVLTGTLIATSSQAELIPYEVAILQGLNKVTARVSEFQAPLNQAVKFGSLEIIMRDCRKNSPEEMPESATFLEIDDVKQILRSKGCSLVGCLLHLRPSRLWSTLYMMCGLLIVCLLKKRRGHLLQYQKRSIV